MADERDLLSTQINLEDTGQAITFKLGGAGSVTVTRVDGRAFVQYTGNNNITSAPIEVTTGNPVTIGRNPVSNLLVGDSEFLSKAGNSVAFNEAGNLILTTTQRNKVTDQSVRPANLREIEIRTPTEIDVPQEGEDVIRRRIGGLDRLLNRLNVDRMGRAQELAEMTIFTPAEERKRGEYADVAQEGYRDLLDAYKFLNEHELTPKQVAALDRAVAMLDTLARDNTIPDLDARVRQQMADLRTYGERYVATGHRKHAVVIKIEDNSQTGGYTVTTFNAGDELKRLGALHKILAPDDAMVMYRQELKAGVSPQDFLSLANRKSATATSDPRYAALRAKYENCLEQVNTRDPVNYRIGPQQHKGDCTQRSPEEAVRQLVGEEMHEKIMKAISRQSADQELITPEEFRVRLRELRTQLNNALPEGKKVAKTGGELDHQRNIARGNLQERNIPGYTDREIIKNAELQLGKLLRTGGQEKEIQNIIELVEQATGVKMNTDHKQHLIQKYEHAVSKARQILGLDPDINKPLTADDVTKAGIEKGLPYVKNNWIPLEEDASVVMHGAPSEIHDAVALLGGDTKEITPFKLTDIQAARTAQKILGGNLSHSGKAAYIPITDTDETVKALYTSLVKLGIELRIDAENPQENDIRVKTRGGKPCIELSERIVEKLKDIADRDPYPPKAPETVPSSEIPPGKPIPLKPGDEIILAGNKYPIAKPKLTIIGVDGTKVRAVLTQTPDTSADQAIMASQKLIEFDASNPVTIGRSPGDGGIVLETWQASAGVSRKQAVLIIKDGQLTYEDIGTNSSALQNIGAEALANLSINLQQDPSPPHNHSGGQDPWNKKHGMRPGGEDIPDYNGIIMKEISHLEVINRQQPLAMGRANRSIGLLNMLIQRE